MRLPVSKAKSAKAPAPALPLRLWQDRPREAGDGESGRTRRDLQAMLGDGISFSLMVGMGETYLPAFVLALGMGQVASGLIGTIPLLVGAILQLVSPLAV